MIKYLNKLFYLLLGLFIISYVFYARLIVVHLPRDLYFFDPINYELIIINISWILISGFIIIQNTLILLKLNTHQSYFQNATLRMQEIIVKALNEVLHFISNFISNSDKMIFSLAKHFYALFGEVNEILFIVISFMFRFIVVGAFLIDVFYFFELNYFYKCLILLCIPICISIVFYLLKDFATNLDEAESFLLINEEGFNNITKEPIFSFTPSRGNEDINLQFHVDYFMICSKISGYLSVYNFLTYYYSSRVNIIIYTMYLIGWSYVSYINIIAQF